MQIKGKCESLKLQDMIVLLADTEQITCICDSS